MEENKKVRVNEYEVVGKFDCNGKSMVVIKATQRHT